MSGSIRKPVPAAVAATLTIFAFATPLAAQEPDVDSGAAIYRENCLECHMDDAAGDDMTPDLRGIPRNNLRRAMGGLEGMPEFALTDAEITAVWTFLRGLDD